MSGTNATRIYMGTNFIAKINPDFIVIYWS
jgi:hypothetical protein